MKLIEKEIKNLTEFQKELLRRLETLSIEDRDFKTLVICMNPDYIRGKDFPVAIQLRKDLNYLEKNDFIIQEKSPKGRNIFTLKRDVHLYMKVKILNEFKKHSLI